MALFEQFAYTNFHGVNLSWLLESMSAANERLDADETRLTAAEASISNYGPRITKNSQDIGAITSLETTDKSNLVAAINELVESGGYGPATSYNSLTDKPTINNVMLLGNKTTADLGINYNTIANHPTINSVELTGNKTTAQLGINYNTIANHPQINGNELTGNKTAAQLGITYAALSGIPIPSAIEVGIAPNASKTVTLTGSRTCLLFVGSYTGTSAYVVSFLQGFQASGGTLGYRESSLIDSTRITCTGDDSVYKWTISNTSTGTFEGRIFVLQGSAVLS